MIGIINSLSVTTFNALGHLTKEVKYFISHLRSVRQIPLQLPAEKPVLVSAERDIISNTYSKSLTFPPAEMIAESKKEPLYSEPLMVDKPPAATTEKNHDKYGAIYDSPRLFNHNEKVLSNYITAHLNMHDHTEDGYDHIPAKNFSLATLHNKHPIYINLFSGNNQPTEQKELINKLASHLNSYYQQQINILHQIIENQIHQINDGCPASAVKLKYSPFAGVSVENLPPRLPPRNKIF